MRKFVIVLLVFAAAFCLGFFPALFITEYDNYQELSARTERLRARIEWVMPSMIKARDYHQKAVDHPELYDHDVEVNQDAEWVIIYDEVIDILGAVGK